MTYHIVCRDCTFEEVAKNRPFANAYRIDHRSKHPDHDVDFQEVATDGGRDVVSSRPARMRTRSDGYERWRAWDGERERYVYVHQLVAIAHGADPWEVFSGGRFHVHHINSCKFDNRPENLEVRRSDDHCRHHNGKRVMTDGGVELPHNARRIDPYEARDAETGAWERATNESVENVEDLEDRGRFAVTFSDGSDHQVVLVEDDAGYVGACDCNGFAFHGDQPGAGCAHVYLLCQMDALSSNTVPEVDDVDVIDGDDMDVDVVEHGSSASGEADEADDPKGGTPKTDEGGSPSDGPTTVDVEDVGVAKGEGTPPGEAKSPALDDPFAGALEDVDDRFVMTLGGDPFIRREGFQRLARREGYRVETEMRTWASDTDCELAEASARVIDEDGEVVATGTGTAYLPEEDLAGAKGNLNELAETRALSRAMGWATGAGISAVEVDASADFDDPDREVATDGGR